MFYTDFFVSDNNGELPDSENAFTDENTKKLYKEFNEKYGSLKELAETIGNKVIEKEQKLNDFFQELHDIYDDISDKDPSICINLIIANDEEIRLHNLEYRNLDSSTDVLSFPSVHYESPGVPVIADGENDSEYYDEDEVYGDLDEDDFDEGDLDEDDYGIENFDIEDFQFDNYSIVDPDSGDIVFGDMVISLERAMDQSLNYGHSLKREVAFLITHSMLHLCGYDHMEESEASIMEEKQESILKELGILRDIQ